MKEPSIDFKNEFLLLRQDLLSFIYRLTCNKQDAEDLVNDTYLSAAKHIDKFRHESSLKTWLYAIAINKAKNNQRVKTRWLVNFQDKGEQAHLESPQLMNALVSTFQTKPHTEFEIREHISYCFQCLTKTLDLPQQVCLWLKDFYGFTISEIETITQLTEGSIKHNLTYAKRDLETIFEHRCAFINKAGVCHQCSELKGILNPAQAKQQQSNELKIKKATQNQTLVDVRIQFIKDLNPLESPNSHLHTYMIERLPDWAEKIR
jgi:RNA polymerase sigma-70 factor, ECF subfamily